MLIILLGILLAILPLVLTTAFPHLVIVSIYSGLGFLLALGWTVFVIFIMARRQRILEWRQKRKAAKSAKRGKQGSAKSNPR